MTLRLFGTGITPVTAKKDFGSDHFIFAILPDAGHIVMPFGEIENISILVPIPEAQTRQVRLHVRPLHARSRNPGIAVEVPCADQDPHALYKGTTVSVPDLEINTPNCLVCSAHWLLEPDSGQAWSTARCA